MTELTVWLPVTSQVTRLFYNATVRQFFTSQDWPLEWSFFGRWGISYNAFTIWCCILISSPPRVFRRVKRRSCGVCMWSFPEQKNLLNFLFNLYANWMRESRRSWCLINSAITFPEGCRYVYEYVNACMSHINSIKKHVNMTRTHGYIFHN